MKSYTDLEQSKKLAEILPLESADMWYWEWPTAPSYNNWNIRPMFHKGEDIRNIPCWSLAALLEQLPYELCDDNGNSFYLQIDKEDDVYQLIYTDSYEDFESIETGRYDDFVDTCYEMIIKLKEQNLI